MIFLPDLPGIHVSLVIYVPLPRKHIPLVKCVPLPKKHISLVICSTGKHIFNWETHIPGEICSLCEKHISLVIWVLLPKKHVSFVIYVPLPMKHISLVVCFLVRETHIPNEMCFSYPGKHILSVPLPRKQTLLVIFVSLSKKHIPLLMLTLWRWDLKEWISRGHHCIKWYFRENKGIWVLLSWLVMVLNASLFLMLILYYTPLKLNKCTRRLSDHL